MQAPRSNWVRSVIVGAPLITFAVLPDAQAQFGDFGVPPTMNRSATTTKTVKKSVAPAESSSASDAMDLHNMHHAGMWMFEYRFMRMEQEGILNNMQRIDPLTLLDNPNYLNADGDRVMSIGTDMTMDMHMFMAMYDVTSKLSVMLMGNYLVNSMNMAMDPMMGMGDTMSMETSGIGDTQVAAMYKLDDYLLYNPMLTVTVNLPTGSIDETFLDPMSMEPETQPYDMQLGSGTYDITPSFAMSNTLAPWEIGYRVSYLWHTHENVQNYKWGDKFKVDLWSKYATTWKGKFEAGVSHAKWNGIEGRDTRIHTNTANYGGMRTDFIVGYAQDLPMGLSAEVRYAKPIHQSLNGFQMETDAVWEVALQWMYMP